MAQPSGSRPIPHIRVGPSEKRTARLLGPVAQNRAPATLSPPTASAIGRVPEKNRRLAHSG